MSVERGEMQCAKWANLRQSLCCSAEILSDKIRLLSWLQRNNQCFHILSLEQGGYPCGGLGGFGQRGWVERKCSCSQQGAVELQLWAYVSACEWGRAVIPSGEYSPQPSQSPWWACHNKHTVVTFEMNTCWPLIMVPEHARCMVTRVCVCDCVHICVCVSHHIHLHTEVARAQVSHTPKSSCRPGDVHKCPPASA